ncbi:MAG TPA: ABC transporter permease [Bacteroides sp.]|nr:ABC transporter permease [Bacteroides sp.]
MRTIIHLLQKEFIQIFRNRFMLPIIFVMPIVQMVVLVFAATLEMKNIEMIVVDKDLSEVSRRMTAKFGGSPFFNVKSFTFSIEEAEDFLRANEADIVLHIPRGFEKDLMRENQAKVQLLIDAVNATTAGLSNAYASNVLRDFNEQIIIENFGPVSQGMERVNIRYSFWYNPDLNYKIYMLPGILVILVTLIGMMLTALNLVREKELGTAEQINVTPIRKYQFIIGKLLPFWVIALFELSFGLLVGKILFHLPMEGSIALLFLFASLYLLVALSIGLFLSVISNSQIQVMFLMFFFFITFVLMAGIFTPAESMPDWAIRVNTINPLAYFIRVIRMILLKGSGFADISGEFFALGLYATVMMSLATWRYRKAA